MLLIHQGRRGPSTAPSGAELGVRPTSARARASASGRAHAKPRLRLREGPATDWVLALAFHCSVRVTEVGPSFSYPPTAVHVVRAGQVTAGGDMSLTAGICGVG